MLLFVSLFLICEWCARVLSDCFRESTSCLFFVFREPIPGDVCSSRVLFSFVIRFYYALLCTPLDWLIARPSRHGIFRLENAWCASRIVLLL